jgi:hypothetical protein
MSADPTMQFPESTQGFNRYAYAGNNPLTNVDPSGFGFWKSLLKIVGIAMNFFTPFSELIWKTLYIFVSGFLASGGDFRGGLLAVVGAGLFDKFGTFAKTQYLTTIGKAIGHALIGGTLAIAAGGRFIGGALGSGFGELLSPFTESLFGPAGSGGTLGAIERTITSAVIGGTASAIGGARFLNGAATAAFGRLYNSERHAWSFKRSTVYSKDHDLGERVARAVNVAAPEVMYGQVPGGTYNLVVYVTEDQTMGGQADTDYSPYDSTIEIRIRPASVAKWSDTEQNSYVAHELIHGRDGIIAAVSQGPFFANARSTEERDRREVRAYSWQWNMRSSSLFSLGGSERRFVRGKCNEYGGNCVSGR